MTWDVDSGDRAMCARVQHFIYGHSAVWNGREYRYPGFVEKEGVRYLGQSVLLVRGDRLPEIVEGLTRTGVAFDLDHASVG